MNGTRIEPTDSRPVGTDDPERKMPPEYTRFLWIVIIYLFLLTAWVWFVAFQAVGYFRTGMVARMEEFGWLLMGYHVILLVITLIGWAIQNVWRRWGTLALLQYAMVLAVLSLTVAALQLTLILHGFLD